jgi:hypothetical protein
MTAHKRGTSFFDHRQECLATQNGKTAPKKEAAFFGGLFNQASESIKSINQS